MGGLINPPGETGITTASVPVPDFVTMAKAQVAGQKAAGWFDQLWRAGWEHVMPGLSLVFGMTVSVLDDIASVGVQLLTKAQGLNTPGYFTLIANALSDLLGFEFDAGLIQGAYSRKGTLGANTAIGGDFLRMLSGELSPGKDPPTGPGWNAACAFMGYGIAFGVREGNIEMLVDMLPPELRIFEGLRSYGVNIAKSLGLGRLGRLCLAPLMKILVADPLTYELNAQYRPTLLSEASIMKAWMRGALTTAQRNAILAKWGHPDIDFNQIELDAATLPSITQIVALNRIQASNAPDLPTRLAWSGVPATLQQEYLDGIVALRCEARMNESISYLQSLFQNRWIDHDDLVLKLRSYGLNDLEIQWTLNKPAIAREYVQKELTLAEIQTGYEEGIIDLSYLDAWATRWGYSPEDRTLLQYLTLAKADKVAATAEKSRYALRMKCLAAKKAGRELPPGVDQNCNPM
jgi:hypothetical protein